MANEFWAQEKQDNPSGAKSKSQSGWKTAQASHWLAVFKGDTTATAPAEYVACLFDSYADHFEDHLVKELHYSTPGLIAEDLQKLGAPAKTWQRAADLGCGTGLMCPPLRGLGFQGRLEGVDLSEGMLLKAVDKGGPTVGYARLLCGDIPDIFTPLHSTCGETAAVKVEKVQVEAPRLDRPPDGSSHFDLVVAADVFVYIGDLEPTFKITSQWLSQGGYFAFSTEALEAHSGVDYRLTDTGRYTHNPSYINELGQRFGFKFCSSRPVVLRMNSGKPVNGHIFVFSL